MKETPEIDKDILLDLAIYAFLRLDGAWFLASAEKYGVDAATELDIKAWELFSERLGKRIAATFKLRGEFPNDLPLVMKVQNTVMNVKAELIIDGNDKAIFRTIDCEVWKMVSKKWTSETAPCYKVTKASISGLLRGAFPGMKFEIVQKQLIPKGDPCCEVEITRS
ncbi:MAG: DUF6125 family protein [Candidatus Sigynarchaeota archaeon]